MEIRQAPHNSKDYKQLVALRRNVLRKPLHLEFSAEELANEFEQWHFGVFENDVAVACMVLVPQEGKQIKMRQVCTQPEKQGQGLGKKLLIHCEQLALEKGFKKMHCNARLTAVTFYKTMGYQVEGNQFMEVGLPHYFMFKHL